MFDLTGVETSNVMPKGEYQCYVSKAEFKTSKSGNELLSVVFTTLNRQNVFHNFNLLHPTEQVRNIAMQELKRMFLAAGFPNEKLSFQSKEELIATVLEVRCNIKVDVRVEEGQNPQNVVKGFMKIDNDAAEIPLGDDGKPVF